MACQLGNHEWTDADVATVRNLYETTPLSAAAIGRKFGVGKGSILGLAKRKGFQERPRLFNNSVSWSPEEDEILRAAIADGKDDLDISHLLSKRTRNGIKNRRISLGIALSGGALARGSSRGAIARNVIDGRAARWERDKSNPKPPMVIHAIFPADLRCEAVPYTPEHAGCRWMISGGRPWLVCAAKRADGESYCRAHSDRSSYFIQREMAA
jgi:hypothetical protein